MKMIAFHLPQFHAIKENDEWWGEGFTEWTNVRRAEPLFLGHHQPRVPLDNNYYDLLEKDVRQWQGKIAKQYGIFGFCFYHYWFDGKLLLEKPLELMLKDGEPDIPFCLSWANEPWTRTWDGKEHEVLISQNYGGKDDWHKHFEYLLNFFTDRRYIKVANKPLFLIYRLDHINNYEEMIAFWRKAAIENGFEGLHIAQIKNSFCDKDLVGVDSVVFLEPMNTINFHIPFASLDNFWRKGKVLANKTFLKTAKNPPKIFLGTKSYDYIWKHILSRNVSKNKVPIYPGAFVDWDNSPRRGKFGFMITGASPDKFEIYLRKLVEKTRREYKTDFIFINAWNEWAEGAYLEPDDKHQFGFLEAIKKVLESIE